MLVALGDNDGGGGGEETVRRGVREGLWEKGSSEGGEAWLLIGVFAVLFIAVIIVTRIEPASCSVIKPRNCVEKIHGLL